MRPEPDPIDVERACERLIVASAAFNDDRNWAALAALYTADGVVVRPTGQELIGRDAIEAGYAATPSNRLTRHACVNIQVDVDGPDAARSTTMVIVFSSSKPAADDPAALRSGDGTVVGRFDDTFELTQAGWRISRREASLSMRL